MHVNAIVLSTLTAVAYAALTVAGALLWRQTRSLAAAMVAVGFAILLLDQVTLLVSYVRIITNFRNSGDALFVIYHRVNSLHVALFGLWVAAVGLVWHTVWASRRRPASS